MLGLVVASGIAFIASFIGYIITAINSFYDDGYGLSISYGNKDLLILTIVSLLMLSLGLILALNAKKRKKTEEYINHLFILVQAALFSIYLLCSILKPIIKGSIEVNQLYIASIISDVLCFAALGVSAFATIKTLKDEKGKSFSHLLIVADALLAISICYYCIYYGSLYALGSDLIAIVYIIVGAMQLVEFAILLINLYIDELAKKKQESK